MMDIRYGSEHKDPGEYDMEGDFTKNQIHTMRRMLDILEEHIADDENLPEWVEMKISQAQGMLVGVTDYLVSEKERSHDMHEDWQKVNRHDKTSGMSKKAVNAYHREHPGSKLKTAVTTKPSKLKKGSKASNRRKSFCARMSGMKKHRTGAKTKHDPNSNINKALRRWHCESVEEMRNLIEYATKVIALEKKRQLLEVGSAGSTTSAAIGTVENPSMNKRGAGGKAPKPFKVKSVNALNSNVSLFGAVGENTAQAIIKR